MTLEKLKTILDKQFGAPFLPEGMVKTKWTDKKELSISIGRRDIQINKKGKVVSAGTFLG